MGYWVPVMQCPEAHDNTLPRSPQQQATADMVLPPPPQGDEEGQGTQHRTGWLLPASIDHRSTTLIWWPLQPSPPSTASNDRSLVTALHHSLAASERKREIRWLGERGDDLVTGGWRLPSSTPGPGRLGQGLLPGNHSGHPGTPGTVS